MRVRLRRLAAVVSCVCAAVVVAGLPGQAVDSSSDQPIRDGGFFERIPRDVRRALGPTAVPPGYDGGDTQGEGYRNYVNGTFFLVPAARQMWHIYALERDGSPSAVAVRDLDTMRLVRTFSLGNRLTLRRSSQDTVGGEWTHAVDGARRVFLYTRDNVGGVEANTDEVLEIDLRTFAIKRYSLLGDAPLPGARMVAFQYDPISRSLLAMFATNGTGGMMTNLLRLNPETGARETRRLSTCDGPLIQAGDFGVGVAYNLRLLVSDPTHLFIPCQRSGTVSAVVRLARTTAFDPTSAEDVAIGPVYMRDTLADQKAGRLYLITTVGEAWVFDSATMSFLGVISSYGETTSTVAVSWGIDEESGRLFFQSASFGFGIVEGRFFPVPQALTRSDRLVSGREMIWSDARTGRIFVLEGEDIRKAYRTYQTDPAPKPPTPANPDSFTLDLAEREGDTKSSYEASGNGYGFRLLLARGFSTLVPSPSVGVHSPLAQIISESVNSRCGFDDREMVAARVLKAEYGDSSAAQAQELEIDERTQVHLEQPSRCHVDGRRGDYSVSTETIFGEKLNNDAQTPADRRYYRTPADCSSGDGYVSPESGSGGKPGYSRSTADGKTKDVTFGTSEVQCPVRVGGPLTARSHASLTGLVDVAKAETTVTIERLPDGGGVRSTVTSYARGIDVVGAIQIGEVWARATSTSNGRPRRGTPGSTHEWGISGVVVNGRTLCRVEEDCRDLRKVLDVLNAAGTGRVHFRVGGSPDPSLLKGTPRGAMTAVQKSVKQQVSDQALIGDFTTEVPTLEMIVYNDNRYWGRARRLYQFAGVSTASSYNISKLPTGDPVIDVPDLVTPEVEVPEAVTPPVGPAGDPPASEDRDDPAVAADSDEPATNVLAAIARGFRLLFADPRSALVLMTVWALFGMPIVLARRRRLLMSLGS